MTNPKILIRLIALVLSLTQSLAIVRAGERANIRGMAMARTFVATSRGIDAVGINPANLALPDSGTVTVSIIPFGAHAGSDFLDYDLYTSYFTGIETDSGRVARYMNESDKRRVLEAFEDATGRVSADVEATVVGISYRLGRTGALALTVKEQIYAFADLPRDYVEFIFNGNPTGTKYEFGGTEARVSWTREFALSFGANIPGVSFLPSFAVGLGAKLLKGYGFYEIQRFDTSLKTSVNATLTGVIDFLSRSAGEDPTRNRSLNAYSFFPQPAGTGYGLDLGIAGAFNDYLSFGISVTDIGTINWTKDTRETYADTTIVVDDPLQELQRDAIEDIVKGRKRSVESFSTPLPTSFRVGFALVVNNLPTFEKMPGELLVGLDYNQGFEETAITTTNPRVSLGVEYKPLPWLPLRSGFSFGGTDGVNLALGFGINAGVFDFELASENITWLFAPRSFSHGSVAAGMRLRF